MTCCIVALCLVFVTSAAGRAENRGRLGLHQMIHNQVTRIREELGTQVTDLKDQLGAQMKQLDAKLTQAFTKISQLEENYSMQNQALASLNCKKGKNLNANNTVAFSVTRSTPIPQVMNPTNVIWEDIITNVGFGWNHEAGQFVATVRGLYIFHVKVIALEEFYSYVHVLKNGENKLAVYAANRSAATSSAHLVLEMDVFDTILVQLQTGYGLHAADPIYKPHFTGFLLTELA